MDIKTDEQDQRVEEFLATLDKFVNDIQSLEMWAKGVAPVRDEHGVSRAFQMAVTKLEGARLYAQESRFLAKDRKWTASGE